jgi:hypothetical protein
MRKIDVGYTISDINHGACGGLLEKLFKEQYLLQMFRHFSNIRPEMEQREVQRANRIQNYGRSLHTGHRTRPVSTRLRAESL